MTVLYEARRVTYFCANRVKLFVFLPAIPVFMPVVECGEPQQVAILPGESSRKQSQSTTGSESNAVASGCKAASDMLANRLSDNARSNSKERTGDTVRHDSRPGTQLNPTAKRRSGSCSSDEIELNGNNVCTGSVYIPLFSFSIFHRSAKIEHTVLFFIF